MNIKNKLRAFFLAMTSLIGLLGVISYFQISQLALPLQSKIPDAVETMLEKAQIDSLAQKIKYLDEVLTQSARSYVYSGNIKWKQRYYSYEYTLEESVAKILKQAKDTDHAIFKKIKDANDILVSLELESFQALKEGGRLKAISILESENYSYQKWIYESGLNEYFSRRGIYQNGSSETSGSFVKLAASNARAQVDTNIKTTVTIVIIAILLSLIIGSIVIQSITQPIDKLIKVTDLTIHEDLSHRVEVLANDEIGVLSSSFNRMLDKIDSSNKNLVESNELLESRVIKRTEELNESNKSLESAILIKSEFLANMSHEIRTPMNAVLGMAEITLENTKEPETVENLMIIKECGNDLLVIINDIIDLSKFEAGKINLDNSPFSIEDSISFVFKLNTNKIKAKNLLSVITIDQNLPKFILGDETKFRQIMNNLISNSIKFTSVGRLSVEASARKNSEKQTVVTISVKDTGIGVPKGAQKHLFEKFTQADSSITRKYGGSGLGLAICKNICEAMGGSITYEDNPEGGSCFTFKFLAEESQQSDAVAQGKVELLKNHEGLEILVVEDNKINQMVLVGILKKWNFIPDISNNGLEAVNAASKKRYDLIFMDCQMPIMDGFTATKQICKNTDPNQVFRIVALSAGVLKDDRKKCFASGMVDFLQKPIQLNRLTEVLNDSIKLKPTRNKISA